MPSFRAPYYRCVLLTRPYSVNADVLLNCVVRDLTASEAAQQECLRDLGSK
jgi:hypothetical protein